MRGRKARALAVASALAIGGMATGVMVVPPNSESLVGEPATSSWKARAFYERFEEEAEYPEDFYLFERTAQGDLPTSRRLYRAARQSEEVARFTRAAAPSLASRRWRREGPTNIGGRVVDITVDPKQRDTIYVASASGGIWKSSDAGMTYRSIWPKRWTQSIGAMDMASDGTIYVGTGETNPGGGSLTYFGSGMYRSRDRGNTWRPIGLRRSWRIGRVLVDPNDPDHVLVAVTGSLFEPGGRRGLYETEDGGATWKLLVPAPNDTTGAVDVQMSPDGKRIYVSMWDHLRYPDWRDYAGPGSGIWRSIDAGKTFERLGPVNGLPPAMDNIGRIGLGMDPQNPDRLYAIYVGDLGTFQYWFISNDGGDTWFQPPGASSLASSQSVYGWWFGRVWVDPKDSNHVFVAGVPLMESVDGGMSFPVAHTEMHVDHHAMAWDPHKEGRVYNGNDGGVYVSEENGALGSWRHGRWMPWVQFYTIDVSPQDPSRINGGLQDQGSVKSWGGGGGWARYYGGDGVKNAINPRDMQMVFACSQYGSCGRSDDGGATMRGMSKQGSRDGWLTPIEFQPGKTQVMYWAGDRINRSTDGGRSWTAVSPDLGKGELGREQNPLYAGHYGTVQAIGLNKADPQTIYAGTDNAYLYKTVDLGRTWQEIGTDQLPARWVTHIEVKRTDADALYVSFSGYRQGDVKAYVLASKDGGKTWTDISANLPQAPVNDVVLVGRRLYAATDVGVFTRKTSPSRWLKVGRGLPKVPINDLRYIRKNDRLYAGTFGHGVMSVQLP